MLSTSEPATLLSNSLTKDLEETPFQIIHATKGRIRLRLPQLKDDSVFVKRLTNLIRSLDFVRAVHVNLAAESLTIDFYAKGCSEAELIDAVAIAIHQAETILPSHQTTTALAQRLGVTVQELIQHRTQIHFAEWSQVRDPEGLSWSYAAAPEIFYAHGYGVSASLQDSSKGQRILQSLTQAAGCKLGAAMGRMTGQAIGLLLGTAGMAVGAEVGTFVGEIVGAELATIEAIEVQG